MVFSVMVLLVGLAVAGLTALYVIYPHRGQDVPHARWLGRAMERRVGALPTVDPAEEIWRDLTRH